MSRTEEVLNLATGVIRFNRTSEEGLGFHTVRLTNRKSHGCDDIGTFYN